MGWVSLILIYALWEFIQTRNFILPIPVFEIGLLLSSIYLWNEYQKDWYRNRSLLIFFSCLSLLFSRTFTYTFFLKDTQILSLSEGPILDIVYLFHLLGLIILLIKDFKQKKLGTIIYWVAALFVLESIVPHVGLAIAGFALLFFVISRKYSMWENGLSIWFLTGLFEVLRFSVLFF